MKKKLEDMSVEELLQEVSKVHKKTNFKTKKFNTASDGTILLEPTDKNDKEWYENDEDYNSL